MATFSVLAPSALQAFSMRDGTVYTADAKSLITGVAQSHIRDLVGAGCIPLGAGTVSDAANWNTDQGAPQVLAAAGATQGVAGVIAKRRVVVTVTASTEGVKLPVPVTGQEVRVSVPGTVGVKVYPHSNGTIDASSTNTAVLLAAGKSNLYLARDATRWVTQKGA